MEEMKRSGILGGVAAALNAGGRALVVVCEGASSTFGDAVTLAKKLGDAPLKVFGRISKSETKKLEEKIQSYEEKIRQNYYEIGREGAVSQDAENPLQKESIQKLIADIREYDAEIKQLKEQITQINSRPREEAKPVEEKAEAAPAAASSRPKQAPQDMKAAITQAVRKGSFQDASAQAIFKKVAEDLLDKNPEVRILAASELGKMGNPAAVPVLMAASRTRDAELTSEAINALTSLGDRAALGLFTELASHPSHRVRMGCLRGIYKLATDDEASHILITALRDEHPEVRRTAVSFLGWKDYPDTAPSLMQCLRDEDANVRKGAIAALANLRDPNSVIPLMKVLGDKQLELRERALEAVRNITGESLAFDLNASGTELDLAVNALTSWWQDRGAGQTDVSPAPVVAAAAPVSETPASPEAPVVEAPVPQASEASAEFELSAPTWDGGATEPAAPEAAPAENSAPVDPAPADTHPHGVSRESIREMNKADLLALCEQMGVAGDPKMSKAEIRKLLLKDE